MTDFIPAGVKDDVDMDLLERLDIRVGQILEVAAVPGSVKLVRLTVDFGDHCRQVLVGMQTERDGPKAITARQALFVVNLPPRRMAGELSEARLFDIGHADGVRPVLAVPEAPVPNGTRAG